MTNIVLRAEILPNEPIRKKLSPRTNFVKRCQKLYIKLFYITFLVGFGTNIQMIN